MFTNLFSKKVVEVKEPPKYLEGSEQVPVFMKVVDKYRAECERHELYFQFLIKNNKKEYFIFLHPINILFLKTI
jgi:hypothetical protein